MKIATRNVEDSRDVEAAEKFRELGRYVGGLIRIGATP
jgi:hypothetical protein